MNVCELLCECGDHDWKSFTEDKWNEHKIGKEVENYCFGCGKSMPMKVISVGYIGYKDIKSVIQKRETEEKTMKFNREFPKMKPNGSDVGDFDVSEKENYYYEEEIMKHCLDKQKVEEVLNECTTLSYHVHPCDVVRLIKKRLGLE